MADHFADDDEHAISITRSIVANLNADTINNAFPHYNSCPTAAAAEVKDDTAKVKPQSPQRGQGCSVGWEEPLFDPKEMGSIIPTDPKKSFDVRKVREVAN